MSYCTKLTDNDYNYPLELVGIKEILNIDPADTSFDNKIRFYFKVAIDYLQTNYNLVIVKNDYLCSYGESYIKYMADKTYFKNIKITLPNKVNKIYDVAKVTTSFSSNIEVGNNLSQPDNAPDPLNTDTVFRIPLLYTLDNNIIKICGCSTTFCFHECKDIKIEIKCSLGWEPSSLPYGLQQVLFSLVADFFNNMGDCDCKKICENKFNSSVLSNYQNFIF